MLPKLPELPGEVWAAISDRILNLDVLLRLTCVNKSIQKSCVPAITHASKYDNDLFDSLLECMKIEVEKHIGMEFFFKRLVAIANLEVPCCREDTWDMAWAGMYSSMVNV